MRILYIDCFSGASGDMLVGALLDAGADFARLQAGLDSLGVAGYEIAVERVKKKGIEAAQFKVLLSPDVKQPHRHLADVVAIIEQGDLPDTVKAAATETFRRIAVAEAKVHGSTVEKVHFHEVGAVDSIVDVVGANLALELLNIERVTASPLNVGGGFVEAAHGVMPVPAPATALLLEGIPSYGTEDAGELVTPTGAALVGQWAETYGPMPLLRTATVGYGSGSRDLPDRANVLRVFIGEADGLLPGLEPITIIEANIDDMNPELYPPLLADALEAGARDAFIAPVIGKKGRPAHVVTVLCDNERTAEAAAALFHGSTTLGVRIRTEHRVCLPREWKSVATAWGEVRVKIAAFDGRPSSAAPEFEDCRTRAQEAGVTVRAVYEAALAAALKGEWSDG